MPLFEKLSGRCFICSANISTCRGEKPIFADELHVTQHVVNMYNTTIGFFPSQVRKCAYFQTLQAFTFSAETVAGKVTVISGHAKQEGYAEVSRKVTGT